MLPARHVSVSVTPSEVKVNRIISRDRIIVENVFGRLCELWTVMSTKFEGNESSEDSVFKLYVSMKNIFILWSPLREVDGQLYQQIETRRYGIAESQAERRSYVQGNYREKRRRRMDIDFRASCIIERQHDSC